MRKCSKKCRLASYSGYKTVTLPGSVLLPAELVGKPVGWLTVGRSVGGSGGQARAHACRGGLRWGLPGGVYLRR